MEKLTNKYVFVLVLGMLALNSKVMAATPDIFDLFDPQFNGVNVCPPQGNQPGQVVGTAVDVDANGTADTQVVFFPLMGENTIISDSAGSGLRYFFSFLDSNCGGNPPWPDKGRIKIRFVDMLAPGFVANNSASWTYKNIKALELSSSHDWCYDFENDVAPYQQISAYRNINQNNLIASSNGNFHQFSDPVGIAELFVTTDFCENILNDFILYENETDIIEQDPEPEVSILMDTSGSMNWGHDGTFNVPVEERRITLAKNAVEPFLLMMNDHYAGTANFGVAAFPDLNNNVACDGTVVRAMETLSTSAVNDTINTTLPGLQVGGNTPLLGGVAQATAMFTTGGQRSIVLLSDGYHNCPGTVSPSDPEVVNTVDGLNLQNISLHAIGFGRPTDIDHPLLETLGSTNGGSFYDVTQAGFDPVNWDAGVALQDTYKSIAVDSLGLDSIVDPLSSIAANSAKNHNIQISPYDSKVTFYVSWACARSPLSVSLYDSFGKQVSARSKGISFHSAKNYWMMTVDSNQLASRVNRNPWRLALKSGSLCSGENMVYQYSVLGQSQLKFQGIAWSESYEPGSPVLLSAKLELNGKTNKMNGKALVEVLQPLPADGEGEQGKPIVLVLKDEGKDGDLQAGDGVYSVLFKDTTTRGTYTFNFQATGSVGKGGSFERYERVKKSMQPSLKREENKPDVMLSYSKVFKK